MDVLAAALCPGWSLMLAVEWSIKIRPMMENIKKTSPFFGLPGKELCPAWSSPSTTEKESFPSVSGVMELQHDAWQNPNLFWKCVCKVLSQNNSPWVFPYCSKWYFSWITGAWNHFLLTLDGGLWVYWVQKLKAGYSLMASAGVKLGQGLGKLWAHGGVKNVNILGD